MELCSKQKVLNKPEYVLYFRFLKAAVGKFEKRADLARKFE